MPALDAIHLKMQLLRDLDSQVWQEYMRIIASNDDMQKPGVLNMATRGKNETIVKRQLALADDEHSLVGPETTGPEITTHVRQSLMTGETYYVAPTMHALIAAAMLSYPLDEPLEAWDLPSPQGFMVIPGGVTALDLRGVPCVTNAILWDTYGGKVAVTLFVDKDSTVTQAYNLRHILELSLEERRMLPRLTPWSFGGFSLGKALPLYDSLAGIVPPEQAEQLTWTLNPETQKMQATTDVNVIGTGLDETDKDAVYYAEEYIDGVKAPESTVLWFITCLKLMQQTIVTATDMQIPRAQRRQMLRVKLANNRATVIELRHRKGQADHETGREYSHRFLRRGHWRRQPYKEDGEWRRRMTWIHPTIVGPEDKPLVIRDHVNALVR